MAHSFRRQKDFFAKESIITDLENENSLSASRSPINLSTCIIEHVAPDRFERIGL